MEDPEEELYLCNLDGHNNVDMTVLLMVTAVKWQGWLQWIW